MRTWIIAGAAFSSTVVAGLLLFPVATRPAKPRAQPAAVIPTSPPGETISLPTLGLSVVRPASWSTVTAEQNARNIRSVDMDDRGLQELAARYATTPIVAFAKYPEPYGDLNPSFKINVRPIGEFAGHAPEEILLAATPTMQRMFGDLKVAVAPTRTTISGKSAAYSRLTYTLRVSGHEFPTVSEIWVVPSGPVFFMIGTGTRADERNGSRAEVQAIVDSIRLR